MIQLVVTGSVHPIAGALYEIRGLEKMLYFRLINFSGNFANRWTLALQDKGISLIYAALWSLLEAIAWHWNLLLCSYRILFWFLLAASGKEKVWFKAQKMRDLAWVHYQGGLGTPRCGCAMNAVPVVKSLTPASCLSLILKHLSCTKRAVPHLIKLLLIWSGSVEVGLSREGLLTTDSQFGGLPVVISSGLSITAQQCLLSV